MVSTRCKLLVKAELEKFGLHFVIMGLGEVDVMEELTSDQKAQLNIALIRSGFELIEDKRSVLVQGIKNIIIQLIHHTDEIIVTNLSDYLSKELDHSYTYMANMFSEIQGITIEQFCILHKVERIKELLIYDELNITEIARKMNYSSVAHLSNQFKRTTGLTPTYFKGMKDRRRSPIEDIGNSNLPE
jgi:AraC-like DNA-binding protein